MPSIQPHGRIVPVDRNGRVRMPAAQRAIFLAAAEPAVGDLRHAAQDQHPAADTGPRLHPRTGEFQFAYSAAVLFRLSQCNPDCSLKQLPD
jgi:hypothetical protein